MDTVQGFCKKSLSGFLSRSVTDASFTTSLPHAGTSLSSLQISDDPKGPLGLVTLHIPEASGRITAELVFVHGLGGGSRKTWSYSGSASHFWPQAWLPADGDFDDVRIHSFGYNADWGERRQSTLNIHDFSQSLLNSLKNDPEIRRGDARIVFICHSMGGCVAKRAYILARQDPTCEGIAARVHSIFFLGTPHRGSDMAAVLEKMLFAAWGRKAFVTDLAPSSSALTMINDTFRHFAPDLRLWSFYETLPVKAGMLNRMIVDASSATLGYHNEEAAAMNADHRHVCKFESPADPNYRILRNALHSALDSMRTSEPPSSTPNAATDPGTGSEPSPNQLICQLRVFLNVQENSDVDLTTLSELKEPGSCRWLTEQKTFVSWRTGSGPNIFWLTGKPASGKSIACSHVIDELRVDRSSISYFFFKHGVDGRSTLGDCFRSLTLQMAQQDKVVMDSLRRLKTDGVTWDASDDFAVWRRLFVNCIFQIPSASKRFWVIDGIDECANHGALFAKRLLTALPPNIRLFAASRSLERIERGLGTMALQAHHHNITDQDTFDDMRLFISTKLDELGRFDTGSDRDTMCDKILDKASGSFLWVRLVVQELENVWTDESVDAVLSEVPDTLHDLYSRMVHAIEADERKVLLAKSIFSWVNLASRPLTLDELQYAIKLDVNQKVHSMEKAVPGLCGQLVYVDRESRVHMIHETAREFLLSNDSLSALRIHKKALHGRFSLLLLRYLSNNTLRPQHSKANIGAKARGFSRSVAVEKSDGALLDYASHFFTEHVYRSSSKDDDVMDELCSFLLSKNVLSWVEYIATTGDLGGITKAAMNLRNYLARRVKYVPPTDRTIYLLESWVTDLIRISGKFSSQLLACPSSIHCLIPPLCPSESIIFKTFVKTTPSAALIVHGLPAGTWDDCLTQIDFEEGQATAVSHGEQYFAVGTSTGCVSLYKTVGLQRVRTLEHQERVRVLTFSTNDEYLVSCGATQIMVWDPDTGGKLHCFPIKSAPLSVIFMGLHELLCAFKTELTRWELQAGESHSVSWIEDESEGGDTALVTNPPPSRAAFMMETEDIILALGYRKQSICLWNVSELREIGQCHVEANNGIDAMVFNPNPEITALVVACADGRLCVFDYTTTAQTFSRSHVYANCMACSPNGRTLATGGSGGVIDVYEFDQHYSGETAPTLIYRVNSLQCLIRDIAISADGLRLVDVHNRQCRVWAPAALVRRDNGLESTSDALTLAPAMAGNNFQPESLEITAQLVASSDGRCVVCGKRRGSVVLFSTANGSEVGVLYHHARTVSVISIALDESNNRLVSADDSGRILVAQLPMPLPNMAAAIKVSGKQLPVVSIITDRSFGGPVGQLIISPRGDRLLVKGRKTEELWELPSATVIASSGLPLDGIGGGAAHLADGQTTSRRVSAINASAAQTGRRSAFQHPSNPAWFVIVDNDTARVFAWADFAQLTRANGIRLEMQSSVANPNQGSQEPSNNHSDPAATATRSVSYHIGPGLVIQHLHASHLQAAALLAWPVEAFDPRSEAHSAVPLVWNDIDLISPSVLSVLGFTSPSTLLFLDANMWVCSTNLPSTAPSAARARRLPKLQHPVHAQRHFFVLSEWRSLGSPLRHTVIVVPTEPPQSRGRDIVFARGPAIVVVKGGLEFSENVAATSKDAVGQVTERQFESVTGRVTGQFLWSVVSGSMHRRM